MEFYTFEELLEIFLKYFFDSDKNTFLSLTIIFFVMAFISYLLQRLALWRYWRTGKDKFDERADRRTMLIITFFVLFFVSFIIFLFALATDDPYISQYSAHIFLLK